MEVHGVGQFAGDQDYGQFASWRIVRFGRRRIQEFHRWRVQRYRPWRVHDGYPGWIGLLGWWWLSGRRHSFPRPDLGIPRHWVLGNRMIVPERGIPVWLYQMKSRMIPEKARNRKDGIRHI